MGSGSTPQGTLAKPHHQPDELESLHTKRPRRETDEAGEASNNKTRVRVTRACDECRRRKDRCDGQRPSCRPCLAAKRTCAYNPSKKRGLRTGYVRSLEMLMGFLLGTVEGLNPWISALLEGEATSPSLRLKVPTEQSGDVSDFSMNSWRKSEVLKKLEGVLSLTESHDDDDEAADGFAARLTQALAGMSKLEGTTPVGRLPISPMDTDGTSPLFAQSLPPSSAMPPSIIQQQDLAPMTSGLDGLDVTPIALEVSDDSLAMPPNWSHLLDLYFSKTHSWFPICHKHDLLRSAYTLANSGQTTVVGTLSHRADAAFLWATLAYSSLHNDKIEAARGGFDRSRRITQNLHETAKRLVLLESGEYGTGHIRALLILALLDIANDFWTAAWATIGQAVYAVTSLKLLGRPGETQSSLDEGVKRTLLGCIALETLIASRLNVRPYFRQSDIQRLGSPQTDGIEEWEPWQCPSEGNLQLAGQRANRQAPGHVLSIFSTFVDMTGFMNHALVEPAGTHQHIDEELEKWKGSMPHLGGDLSEADISPQVLNLYLAINSIDLARNSRRDPTMDFQQRLYATERCQRILQLCEGLQRRVQGHAGIWMPPMTPLYLFLTRESLGVQKGSLQMSSVENEWRVCQASLLEAECAWREYHDSKTRYSVSQETTRSMEPGKQIIMTSKESSLGMHPTPIDTEPMFPSQTAFSQPVTLPDINDVALERLEETGISLLGRQPIDNGEERDASMAFSSVPKPSQGHGMELDSFPDLMGRMEETELFDSLATLDPADWVANPDMEFMRHLGDLRDVPTDIHSFFDPDGT